MGGLLGIHEVKRDGKNAGSLSITQNGLMTVFECECDLKSESIMRLAGVSGGQYVKIGVMEPSGGVLKLRKSFSKNSLSSLKLESQSGFFLILPDEVYSGNEKKDAVIIDESVPEQKPNHVPESVSEPALIKPLTPEPVLAAEPKHENNGHTPEIKAEKPPDPPPEPLPVSEPVKPSPVPSGDSKWSPIADPSVLFIDEDIANACKDARGALTRQQDGVTYLAIPVSPGEPFPMMPVFCFGDSEMLGGREYIVFKSKNGNFIT